MADVVSRLKIERIRSSAHLEWIRSLPCSVSGCRRRSWAHHLTCGPEPKARSLKAGDNWTAPLCTIHHGPGYPASLHAFGDERRWWAGQGIDPIDLCRRLWAASPENERT